MPVGQHRLEQVPVPPQQILAGTFYPQTVSNKSSLSNIIIIIATL